MTSKKFLSLMAVGDAFGMKYEFVEQTRDITMDDLSFGPHPKFTEYETGKYTDDTQMSLANAELLIKNAPQLETLNHHDFISSWLSAFKRDPRMGYSRYMYKVMRESENPQNFQSFIDATKGTTSGGAMRAAPFGLLPNIDWVKDLTTMQAKITHATPAGTTAALAIALSTHYLHHGGSRDRLLTFIEGHLGVHWNDKKNGYTDDPNNGLRIVTLALNALDGVNSLSECLIKAVNQISLSDTDTVCALAMVMASRCDDITDDLPPHLYNTIENSDFGFEYLSNVDQKIQTQFQAQKLYGNHTAQPKYKMQ